MTKQRKNEIPRVTRCSKKNHNTSQTRKKTQEGNLQMKKHGKPRKTKEQEDGKEKKQNTGKQKLKGSLVLRLRPPTMEKRRRRGSGRGCAT